MFSEPVETSPALLPEPVRQCAFSPDRRYRYWLQVTWDFTRPLTAFAMLNPSVANEETNDPTVERCCRRALAWGYGGLVVVNIFALVSTDPAMLYKVDDPYGPENPSYLHKAAVDADLVVCAWGSHGKHLGQGRRVLDYYRRVYPDKLRMLKMTNGGQPAHPLYLSYGLRPQPVPVLR